LDIFRFRIYLYPCKPIFFFLVFSLINYSWKFFIANMTHTCEAREFTRIIYKFRYGATLVDINFSLIYTCAAYLSHSFVLFCAGKFSREALRMHNHTFTRCSFASGMNRKSISP
jgi:hypothetical protein